MLVRQNYCTRRQINNYGSGRHGSLDWWAVSVMVTLSRVTRLTGHWSLKCHTNCLVCVMWQLSVKLVTRCVTCIHRNISPLSVSLPVFVSLHPIQNICIESVIPRPTQPCIPSWSVNKCQLRLKRQRQVWFIPLPDERGVCIPWERVRTWAPRGVFTTRRCTNTLLPLPLPLPLPSCSAVIVAGSR